MYNPKGNGKEKAVPSVQFIEQESPLHLRGIVHRFLEIKTQDTLSDDYRFHALPDACTYIVFDQLHRKITGVSKLRATSEEFNLGKVFHFINIRFLPGVWQDEREPIVYGLVNTPYEGDLPLIDCNHDLSKQKFADSQSVLADLVEKLIANKLVAANPVTEKIFQHLDEIHSVSDMPLFQGCLPASCNEHSNEPLDLRHTTF